MESKEEKFIQVINQRIKELEKECKTLDGDHIAQELILSGTITGLKHSLNLFKILNDKHDG